ncbi:MAG: hypothetical protein GXX96_38475 [Planctomycetaceae bacterium]|nr:hypothetical protein [Planctomycetaceae bacterium]
MVIYGRSVVVVLAASLVCCTALRAQEVSTKPAEEQEIPVLFAYVEFMQVPEGGDELYLKVEELWRNKVHAVRQAAGLVNQWVLFKVERSEGPTTDYNYAVVHLFDS